MLNYQQHKVFFPFVFFVNFILITQNFSEMLPYLLINYYPWKKVMWQDKYKKIKLKRKYKLPDLPTLPKISEKLVYDHIAQVEWAHVGIFNYCLPQVVKVNGRQDYCKCYCTQRKQNAEWHTFSIIHWVTTRTYINTIHIHKKTFVHQLITLKKNSNVQKCKSHEME